MLSLALQSVLGDSDTGDSGIGGKRDNNVISKTLLFHSCDDYKFHEIQSYLFYVQRSCVCRAVDSIITHAPVHISDFRGVRARYVKRTG